MIKCQKSFLFIFYISFSFLYAKSDHTPQKEIDSSRYYYDLVLNPVSKEDLLKAYTFYVSQKEMQLKKKDTTNTIYSLRQIAFIQHKLGLLHESEKSSIEALQLIENQPINEITNESKAGIYNRLGRIYRILFDYKSAIEYYKKALELYDNESYKIVIKNNIGYAYLMQNEFALAEEVLLGSIEQSEVLNDSANIARSLNNLGIVYSMQGLDKATNYYNEALKIRLRLKNQSYVLSSYFDIAEHYKRNNDLDKASLNAQKAYTMAKTSNNPKELVSVLGLLVSLKQDPEVLKYKELQDSIQRSEIISQGRYTSKKYALEKQERLASERLLEIEKEKNLKIIYGFSAFIIGIIAFLAFMFLKAKHKKQKQLEVYNTELRISKKVHDEVANDVYHIMNKIQHQELETELVLDDLEVVYNKTRDISREHGNIQVNEDFNIVLLDLLRSYKNEATNIIVSGVSKIDWDQISEKKKIAIYRVLQELMINMKKHSQAALVAISFIVENKKIIINYTDDGVGTELNKQNGLLNTENRIFSLNGTITFKTNIEKGFKVLIRV